VMHPEPRPPPSLRRKVLLIEQRHRSSPSNSAFTQDDRMTRVSPGNPAKRYLLDATMVTQDQRQVSPQLPARGGVSPYFP
jgi:hypothetical protein